MADCRKTDIDQLSVNNIVYQLLFNPEQQGVLLPYSITHMTVVLVMMTTFAPLDVIVWKLLEPMVNNVMD